MKKVVFGKGEVVFREGDLGSCFYEIEKGTAGVYLNYGKEDQRKLTDMKPGQIFGEMAVIEAWPRSTTIVAEEELHVIEISEEMLNEYFTEQPERIHAMIKQLCGRIRELTIEYDEVKAFIEEKKDPEAEKKPGFLAKLKKYRELSLLAKKNTMTSAESVLMMKDFGKAEPESSRVLSYNKGQIIFREGDIGNFMYVVYGGAVGIYTNYGTTRESRLTTLYSTSFFGEMGLVEQEKRSATAVVEEDGTILECIRADELEEIFKSNPVKVDMLLSHLSHRLRWLTRDYSEACEEAAKEA